MRTRHVLYAILCIILVLGSCSSAKNEAERAESTETVPEMVQTAKTHVGGCILAYPAAEAPSDLYQESDIIQTDEYKPFTKKLSVYGITLIGRDDITDDFMKKVATTIKEMFPQDETIDDALQKELLSNLYRYRTAIPFFKGRDYEFSPSEQAEWDVTTSKNSICDIIMEGVPGQVNEVVEHILHHVSDVGLHYTFPNEWGVLKTSNIYDAMQEAIDKGHYNIGQYGADIDDEERTRVLIQEYAYWVIVTAWDLLEPYAPKAEWTGIKDHNELKEKLPTSYEIFEKTIPKVIAAPSRSTLDKFIK